MEVTLLNIRRIAPIAALAVLTALTLSACGASTVTAEGRGLTVSAVKTGEAEIPADFLESYPTEGKACIFDVTIENTSDAAVSILGASIGSDSIGTVEMGNLESDPGKGDFYSAMEDRYSLAVGVKVEYTTSVSCIATDAVFRVSGPGGSKLVELPLGL